MFLNMTPRKIKMMHEMDHANPEEAFAYQIQFIHGFRDAINKYGVMNAWIDKLLNLLVLDYAMLYAKNALLTKYPKAYLNAQESKQYDKHLERLDHLSYYIEQNSYLLNTEDDEYTKKQQLLKDMDLEMTNLSGAFAQEHEEKLLKKVSGA